jgi:Nickel responsive protein SCO4226-like
MRKFMIEREIAGVGKLDSCELAGAARRSNTALAELGPGIQWQHSYVTADRTFCVYLAESEELIRAHAQKSGFPATRITEITGIIDPTTAVG